MSATPDLAMLLSILEFERRNARETTIQVSVKYINHVGHGWPYRDKWSSNKEIPGSCRPIDCPHCVFLIRRDKWDVKVQGNVFYLDPLTSTFFPRLDSTSFISLYIFFNIYIERESRLKPEKCKEISDLLRFSWCLLISSLSQLYII